MTEPLALTTEMIAVMAILGLALYLFAFDVVRVDVAAVLIMVLLGLTSLVPGYPGLIPPTDLFNGFASNAVISIIAVMIIGAGLDKTGVMNQVAARILQYAGRTESRIIAALSGTVAAISSFMQNVGAAALFLPVAARISKRVDLPLSRLLMPMGFCAILGGTLTMIGSSPLILLNDLILSSNRSLPSGAETMQTFDMFAVTPVGIALVAAGVGYFVVFGHWVLPTVTGKAAESGSTLQYFENLYGIEGVVYELRVTADSPLAGGTLGDVEGKGRAGWIIAIRNGQKIYVEPAGNTEIRTGSELAVMGSPKAVEEFARQFALEIKPEMESFAETLSASSAGISEVVIPPDSDLIGKSLGEIRLRRQYGATVLAVYRVDSVIDVDLPNIVLQAGDTLVLHSRWRDLTQIAKNPNFVVVTDFPREDTRPDKLKHAAVFFAIALGLILFTDMRLSIALLTGAVGMILTGVLTIDEAYGVVSWRTVFLLASLIPLGEAVETTGTAAWIAQQTLSVLDNVPTWVLQLVIAALATGFTLVISNVGATVLLVPIAINIAIAVGANPAVFALTVALATSNSFLIPTHQVNALIMGPGGYRVVDFMRAGGIMTVIFLGVMMLVLNILY